MRRVVLVLLTVAVVVLVAWGIFRLPGSVSAEIGPYSFAAASPVAALAAIVVFVAIYLVLRLLGFVVFMPRRLRRWRAVRHRRFGDIAVTRALVALAAGESGDARRESGRARRLLGDTPQTLLLTAEAGRLSGREDEAAAAFRALSERDDAAFLGFRGLLRQAMEREDWAEASAIARRAEAAHPAALWLRKERAALAIRTRNWGDALAQSDADAPKAALAAAAAEQAATLPSGLRLGRQAWKEDRALPAAALAYAARLRADGRESRAQSVLRKSWEAAAHPDLAVAFIAPLPDAPSRLAATQRLTRNNPTHPESRLALARAALAAGRTEDAQFHADAVRAGGLNQRRVWLLLAEIADAQAADPARAEPEIEAARLAHRDALRRATVADPDPVWRCTDCRTPQTAWQPVCPACGKTATLRWDSAPVSAVTTLATQPAA
jgi:HemY protein